MLETDLYSPLKEYLERHGYQVQAEVKNCDIVATRDDELIIVELKTSANLTLLVQATERQSISDNVYVAIPKPKKNRRSWLGIQRVIKRLELGLLVVNQSPLGSSVVKLFDPLPQQRRKNKRKQKAVIQEIADRSGNYNIAGSSRKKLMTAYKENVILIACCLKQLGPSSPKKLRELGTGEKTTSILNSNHYGWFQRIERGIYKLTQQGAIEAASYQNVYRRSESLLRATSDTLTGQCLHNIIHSMEDGDD